MEFDEMISQAVQELAAIPYFPPATEVGARRGIMRALRQFVAGPRELRWLIDTAVGRMREWQGVVELRGLYCTRFQPKDSIEEFCSIPGFTPTDSEAAHVLKAAEQRKQIEALRSGHDGLKKISGSDIQ